MLQNEREERVSVPGFVAHQIADKQRLRDPVYPDLVDMKLEDRKGRNLL